MCMFAGACRQVMSEFGNFDIYCVRADGMVSRTTLHDLIPFTFTAHQLSKAPGNSVGQEE